MLGMAKKELTLRIIALRDGRRPSSSECARLLGLEARIKKVSEVVNAETSYYEDPMDEVEVCVTSEKSALHDIMNRILPLWCDVSEAFRLLSTSKPPEWLLSISGIENHILDGVQPSDEDKDVEIESFGLGSFLGLNTYVQHYTSQSGGRGRQPVRITQQSVHFMNCENKMYVYFVDVRDPGQKSKWDGDTHARHRMQVSYASICRIVFVRRRDNSTVAYFHLLSSPLLYRVHRVQRERKEEWADAWNRNYEGSTISAKKADPDDDSGVEPDDEGTITALKKEAGPSPAVEWDVKHIYVQRFEATSESNWTRVVEFGRDEMHCGNGELGRCRVLKIVFPRNPRHWDALGAMILHFRRKIPVYFGPVEEVPVKKGQGLATKSLSFGCQYALECCRSCSMQIADEIFVRGTAKEVSASLRDFAAEDEIALQEALYDLQRSLSHSKVVTFKVGLERLYRKYRSLRTEKKRSLTGSILGNDLPHNVVLIRKAVVTPTKTVFLPPQTICTSRILQSIEADHALRVIVRDDDGRQLSFSLGVNRQAFLDGNTKPRLLKGIRVGSRKYDFLASSTSQLRDHGIYYYSEDSRGRTAADVRADIGDLSAIRNPSKYMARLGLAFSQAIGHIHVPRSCTEVVEDVLVPGKKEGMQYNFSDGVGRISQSLLQKVHRALPREGEPCAIQIRYGGAKGMLVLDPTLKGDRIVFRKSMYKYPSEQEQLFVLKTSKPRVVKLNRPMITILGQKGPKNSRDISPKVFLKLQKKSLDDFADSLFDAGRAAATLHAQSALDLPYRELASAGLAVNEEPFFLAMLRTIHRRSIRNIKEKGNIPIPPEFGRTMFGVMDETVTEEGKGTLCYGQVFVRYAKDLQKYGPGDEYVVLEGDVIVTKNPCLHPGDIRRLKAVDVPALHHIRDCIVFPREGKRPHPDEMAGSDLDGDEYSVIWYKDLIFHDNENPMDFYSNDPPSKDGPIEVEDMVNFFCTYICNDVLGLIASAHLAWADFLERGVKSDMCKTLARKASQSVDYAKTGSSQNLRSFEKVQRYPDFMEKHATKDTYLSKSVLGHLYRKCMAMEVEAGPAEATDNALPDPRLLLSGRESYAVDAERELRDYELKMASLLTTYGIDTEAEALSGAVLSMGQFVEEKHNPDDMHLALQCQVAHIVKQTREQFFRALPKESDYREAKLKASAWYDASYRHGGASGFPWVVADVLRKILEDGDEQRPPERGTLCDRLKRLLLKGMQKDNEFEGVITNNCIVILDKWMERNEEVLRWGDDEGKRKYRCLTTQITRHVVAELTRKCGKEQLKERPSLVLLNCLKKAYSVCFESTAQEPYSSSTRERYLLGTLALKSFNKLISKGSDNTLLEQKEQPKDGLESAPKSVILVRMTNEESGFYFDVVRYEQIFVYLLRHWTNVEDVEVSVMEDRLNQWFLRLWVTGKPSAVEMLKRILMHEQFKQVYTSTLEQWNEKPRDGHRTKQL